ncbi:RUN and FYVE domain-containing protein 4 [Sceloporus undulatus]|uniref:RUN and FYVE domain-containing protein 4 n=1 Tax=Sceloporus undulatus TaxID=8520 RepID=UPI001C4D8977|nr:RUN and FYVE domain-containing protein 4 [Sceloporus undulatus]
MASTRELLRVIRDLENTVIELNANYQARGLPVTDGSRELQQFCAQLEFLLQYDLKEKRNLFGQKKDYWDFLSRILTRLQSGVHAGLQHVTSLDKVRTSVGKGRAFIRYGLVHQQLAETLHLLMEPEVTSEWYYARSPFLDRKLWLDILGSLYELDGIIFHLALCRADLDAAWPMVSESVTFVSPRALPQCSIPVASHVHAEIASSEIGNSNQGPGNNHGATKGHKNSLITKDPCGPESTDDNAIWPRLEHSMEKWVGPWRSRKNSLLQMGSLLKQNYFMEKEAQHSASGKEVQRENVESKTQVVKLSKVSSTQDLSSLLPQPEHFLCGKMEHPHQVSSETDGCWEQKDLRALMWELSILQLQLAQQKEENKSLKQALSEENQALKEELANHEKQHKEKMDEQEKQQQELSKVAKSLREAECKLANLTSECQEAWASKDAAERFLKEAEQRLNSQEAEHKKCLADMEAQELKHQQMISQCQGLQEKLKMCEESLERWETQVAALSSQHSQLETSGGELEGRNGRAAETMLEKDLLREKLERRLAEIKVLENEKETLTETLISQEKSLAFTKLEMQDLQKKLLVCQEHVVTLQMSLQKKEKALKDKEGEYESLQRDLKAQSGQLQETLEKNTTLEAQLEEMTSKKSHLAAQLAEEQARCERTRQELISQLGIFEKEAVKLQEERKQLQASLQQALKEREALAKHIESTIASLEGQIQEATQLRSELENVKATSQALQKALQDKNEMVASSLREQCLQLKTHVEQLEQEKMQATHIAKKLSEELEQCWEWPTEESAPPCGNVLELARPQLTDTDILQDNVPQGLERAVKKVGSAKHEAHSKSLTSHLGKLTDDVQQAKQKLAAKLKTTMNLMEQLNRCQQEKEQLQFLLAKSHQETEEKEKKYKQQLSEQGELFCSMKGKLLELLREKDALWQKTEGIASPVVCSTPQNSGVCSLCKKDFRLMSRRYQCRLARLRKNALQTVKKKKKLASLISAVLLSETKFFPTVLKVMPAYCMPCLFCECWTKGTLLPALPPEEKYPGNLTPQTSSGQQRLHLRSHQAMRASFYITMDGCNFLRGITADLYEEHQLPRQNDKKESFKNHNEIKHDPE